MKALKDAAAEALEGVAKLDKNHEHSPGMQEEGVGSEDQSPGACEGQDEAKAGEAATLERQGATVSVLWVRLLFTSLLLGGAAFLPIFQLHPQEERESSTTERKEERPPINLTEHNFM